MPPFVCFEEEINADSHARTHVQLHTPRADEEDPVDIKPELEEQCKPKCAKFLVRRLSTPFFPMWRSRLLLR